VCGSQKECQQSCISKESLCANSSSGTPLTASALGVGLRCGSYGEAELMQAGAYRVYKDTGDLLDHLAEIGIPLE
jgi:hypothetical protein